MIDTQKMASGSNNLPEETGPPKANQVSQKHTRKDNIYLNNKEIMCKTIKNNLWSSSNLEKIFKFKNQAEDDTQSINNNNNNSKQIAVLENSNGEISLFNYKIENMSGESRCDINKNVNNNTKNCPLFGEEEVTVKLKDLRSKLSVVEPHGDELYDYNENILCNYQVPRIDKSSRSEQVDGGLGESSKKRNFLYQDVNEALNSLLWQPYEYQNKNNANEEYFSLSSFDSCCSLSSFDLESEPNNELDRLDNSADLHLDVVMMVNNPEGNSNRLNLSRESNKSRESLTGSPPSRLLSNVSRNESVGDGGRCCVVSCDEFKNSVATTRTEMSSHPGCLTTNNIVTTTAANRSADVAKTTVSVVNLNQSNSDGTNPQQRRLYVTPSSNPNDVTKRLCHRSNIIGNSSNLNSINVVGLPNHARHASMPCSSNRNSASAAASSATTGKGFMFPNHPRNSSEPSTAIQQPVVANHVRNSSTPATNSTVGSNHIRNVLVPASNLRNQIQSVPSNVTINQSSSGSSTNISCANIVSILSHHRHSSQDIPNYMPNTLRCASVPKTSSYKIGESGTTTLNITNNHQQSRVPINVTAVDVNFYRAVPVTVVSNVPTIQCINNVASERGNSISNVNIVQAMPQTSTSLIPVTASTPITSDISLNRIKVQQTNSNSSTDAETPTRLEEVAPRTFISTEAQTDDTLAGTTNLARNNNEKAINREQRRRERRERRHLRRINNVNHQHGGGGAARERLPDLLSNHMPPPYTTANHLNSISNSSVSPNGGLSPGSVVPNLVVPNGVVTNRVVPNSVVTNHVVVPYSQGVGPGQLPLVQAAPVAVSVSSPPGCRFPFSTTGFRRSRYSEEHPKSCCGFLAWKPGSLRWFIALIAVVAVCCVLVGTALGAMRPAGRDHLTVSLLMIGVGIVLVTVSGVAWRLTSHDTSTCRAMLGLGSTESVDVCPRRFVPRLPPTYGRPHHPYAAMIYPEFQYRPPPPTYQASMQEYRLRLLLLDRANTPQIQNGIQNGPSPPPTYRSYAGSLLRGPLSNRRDATQSEYSFPPSYRSQTGSTRPTTDLQTNAIIHSREHSLSLSESNHGDSAINCSGYINNGNENINLDNLTIDSLKLTPPNDINHVSVLSKGSCSDLNNGHDTNLVTIVQTNDQNPVIVTVSGCSQNDIRNSVQITEVPSEMEILAHL